MSHQLSLSLELILLLDWFLKNGKKQLRFLVKKAAEKDLARDLENISDHDYVQMLDSLQDTVASFVVFLEDALLDCLEEIDADVGASLSVCSQLDSHALDTRTLWLSLQQTRKKRALPEQEVKQEFFKQLLKNWKPGTGEVVN